MPGFMSKVGGFLKDKAKEKAKSSNLGRGISAFRGWKDRQAKRQTASKAPDFSPGMGKPEAPKVPKIGEFEVGKLDTNLRMPKPNKLGGGNLFKVGGNF